MRRYYYLLLIILFISIGCAPETPAAKANQPPVAYIDSVSASQVAPGEEVTFTGRGVDPDGVIMAYKWWSSNDGDLSTASTFSTTTLSAGTHSIWFQVQDNAGSWSKEVSNSITIVSVSDLPPVIHFFEATPKEIGAGQSVMLNWDVSNAALVEISDDIGTVSATGTKAVIPSTNTVYKITASNKNGQVSNTAEVSILTVPTHSIELYAVAAESGHVRSDGVVGPEAYTGVVLKVHSGLAVQAFLSYDISNIPKGKKIKSAYIDATAAKITGDPFQFLKTMYIYVCGYKQLSRRDYHEAFEGGPICTVNRISNKILTSASMTEAVQTAVDSGNPRFQIRLQFALCKCRQEDIGLIDFSGAGSKLVLQYQD